MTKQMIKLQEDSFIILRKHLNMMQKKPESNRLFTENVNSKRFQTKTQTSYLPSKSHFSVKSEQQFSHCNTTALKHTKAKHKTSDFGQNKSNHKPKFLVFLLSQPAAPTVLQLKFSVLEVFRRSLM